MQGLSFFSNLGMGSYKASFTKTAQKLELKVRVLILFLTATWPPQGQLWATVEEAT